MMRFLCLSIFAILSIGPSANAVGKCRVFKTVTVYRGVRVPTLKDYQPDYDLFNKEDGLEPTGSIYVGMDRQTAVNFASPHDDKPVGLVITYKVPSFLLHDGKSDGAYRIYAEDIQKLGINSIQPFVVKVERSYERSQ
jgi:hypothetical protein